MPQKIDLKDRRILYELDINSRQSYSQIGKKVKLPKSVVHYRINSLKDRGILKNTYAIVNFIKLGYSQYKVYLKFHSINPKKEEEIISYLAKKEKVIWVTSCRGEWNISITIISKNIVEFDKILKDIINKYGKFILDKVVLIVSYSPLYSRNYIAPEKEKKEFLYMKNIENIKVDEIEEKILKILANNSRVSILDIIKKLNLTRDIISYRTKNLEKSEVILGYRALINLDNIGIHLYKVILRLQNFSEQKESELISYCKSIKNIVQYMRLVGNWDAEIEVEIESEEKLYDLINEIRNKFGNIIKDYEVLHIVEEHKLNFYPL
ncbi:Lrp/AsnC family transcriptional regulator [Candidatus Pacearchaeota archaeon]|nr:Lrp/AsnC family transcriptional regulator [Candidatus Pacearchaeota archaeon]